MKSFSVKTSFIKIHLTRISKYILTGILATLIHIFVAIFLIEYKNIHPAISNFIAFTIATLITYSINSLWTFNQKLDHRTLTRYILVSMFCSILSAFLSQVVYILSLHYLIGIGVIAITVPWIAFFCHKKITFNKENLIE